MMIANTTNMANMLMTLEENGTPLSPKACSPHVHSTQK